MRIRVSYDIDTWKSRLYFLELNVWISLFPRTSVTQFLGGVRIFHTNLIKTKKQTDRLLRWVSHQHMNFKTNENVWNIVKIVVTEKDRSNVGADKKYAECLGHKKDAYFEEEQDCCMVWFFTAFFGRERTIYDDNQCI